MIYEIERTNKFKRDYKLIKKRGYDLSLLADVITLLVEGKQLPEKYKDHALSGDWEEHREWGVSWRNNQFITVGSSGTILTSHDGITWTKQNSEVLRRLVKPVFIK